LKPDPSKPSLFIKPHEELTLSAHALGELLQAFSDRGLPLRFRVKGTSMAPFIKDGDVITVSPLTYASLRTGHIVAFSDPETKKVRVHRVIKAMEDQFIAKGDNVPVMDGIIPKKNYLGCVRRVERQGRRVSFGLGIERLLIVFISSRACYHSLIRSIRAFLGMIKKRGS
jgi:signal peptidase I